MDINKLKCNILGLSETRLSSDIEMLLQVPSLDLFTNNTGQQKNTNEHYVVICLIPRYLAINASEICFS